MDRDYYSAVITIVSRTRMSNNRICVGAWNETHECMVRVLDNKGGALLDSASYAIGEKYFIRFAAKDNLHPPHTEDIVVYKSEKIEEHEDFSELIDSLAEQVGSIRDLFDGTLVQYGRALHAESPNNLNRSVQIAELTTTLIAEGEYYRERGGPFNSPRVKFVGFENPGPIIHSGEKIRFSLTRPWDRDGNGAKSYLQISGVY